MAMTSKSRTEAGASPEFFLARQINDGPTARAADYLAKAEAAWQEADRALSHEARQTWVGLAKSWESLAVLAEKHRP